MEQRISRLSSVRVSTELQFAGVNQSVSQSVSFLITEKISRFASRSRNPLKAAAYDRNSSLRAFTMCSWLHVPSAIPLGVIPSRMRLLGPFPSGNWILRRRVADAGKANAGTAGPVVLYSTAQAWRAQFHRSLTRTSVSESSDEEEDLSQYQFEDDLEYLRSLDPRDWKDQDHYAVLGIKDLRHRATEDLIKRACT